MLLATWDGDLARAAVAAGAASHRRQHAGDKCRPVVAQVDPLRAGFSRNEVAGSAPHVLSSMTWAAQLIPPGLTHADIGI